MLGTQRLQARFAAEPSALRAFGVRFDWYRAVMGSPGAAGKMNAYGEALQAFHRASQSGSGATRNFCTPLYGQALASQRAPTVRVTRG